MNKNNKIPKFSFSWLYLIIGIALLSIWMFDDGNTNQKVKKTYTEVEDYIRNGYVEEITFTFDNPNNDYVIMISVLVGLVAAAFVVMIILRKKVL